MPAEKKRNTQKTQCLCIVRSARSSRPDTLTLAQMSQSLVNSRLDSIISTLSASAWTDAERSRYCADVGSHPLFSVPSLDGSMTTSGDSSTVDASAARAAVTNVEYDELDSPLLLATEAKERGNAAFAAGGTFVSHAMRHYTDALRHARVAALTDADAARSLRALVHANIAAVHLAGGHFISALEESTESLRCGGGAKAAWRAGKACLSLGRASSCLEFCDLGRSLVVLPSADAFLGIAAESALLIKAQRANAKTTAVAQADRRASLARVRVACSQRRIAVGPPLFAGMHRTAAVPYIDEHEELHWPVNILYPEHGQSDWFDDVGESTLAGDMVDNVLSESPEWAPQGLYVPDGVDIFFKARPCKAVPLERAWAEESLGDTPDDDPRGSDWVLVPRDAPLLLIIAQPSYVVADVPLLYVVPRKSPFWEGMRRDAGGTFPVLVVPDFGDRGDE